MIHRIVHTWKQTERGNQPIADALGSADGRRDANAPDVRTGAPASLQAKISPDAAPAVLTRTARRGG